MIRNSIDGVLVMERGTGLIIDGFKLLVSELENRQIVDETTIFRGCTIWACSANSEKKALSKMRI